MYAEPAACYLDDGVFAVGVKIFVKAPLPSVIEDAKARCGAGQRSVGLVTYGAVTHGGKHDRHGKLQLRWQVVTKPAVLVPLDFFRLFSQKYTGLHGFPQWVNGRVGYL